MAPTQPVAYRFSVQEYHRMGEAGIFGDDERVELLDGEVVQMVPIGSPHASSVDRLNRLLTAALGDRAIVRVQGPIVLDDWSEPEPDVTVLVPRDDFYAAAHPRPADVLLLVEVADTSGFFDRNRKLPLYAASGVAEAWIVDVRAQTVEVYLRPAPSGYEERRAFSRGDSITPAAFPQLSLAVADMLT